MHCKRSIRRTLHRTTNPSKPSPRLFHSVVSNLRNHPIAPSFHHDTIKYDSTSRPSVTNPSLHHPFHPLPSTTRRHESSSSSPLKLDVSSETNATNHILNLDQVPLKSFNKKTMEQAKKLFLFWTLIKEDTASENASLILYRILEEVKAGNPDASFTVEDITTVSSQDELF